MNFLNASLQGAVEEQFSQVSPTVVTFVGQPVQEVRKQRVPSKKQLRHIIVLNSVRVAGLHYEGGAWALSNGTSALGPGGLFSLSIGIGPSGKGPFQENGRLSKLWQLPLEKVRLGRKWFVQPLLLFSISKF